METRLYKFSVKCIVSYAAFLCLVTQRPSNAGCENLIDSYARLQSSQSSRLNFSAVAWVVVYLHLDVKRESLLGGHGACCSVSVTSLLL